jgi:F-type H+-transporting ATPase subunit gamma
MATLRDVRRKIGSIQSTQTITRTMRMVSASKLRRAQEQLDKIKGYALNLEELLKRVAARLPEGSHPLLTPREEVRNVLLFPIASDRGLSGAFNLNISTRVETFIRENKQTYDRIGVYLVGRKIRDYLRKRRIQTTKELMDVKTVTNDLVQGIAGDLIRLYQDGEFDRIYLIYTQFKSAIKQEVIFEEFIPVKVPQTEETIDYLYEPGKEEIIERLVPHYVSTKIFYALTQSQTSEHAARMAAMENATSNCGEMINYLTLVYNKTRQESITAEMMDIVGGAEALQGE